MNEYRDATLGDLLQERRATLGMTMREVAGGTLSPTAVNNIEKGKIRPTVDTVLYLCKVLKLQPEQALIFYPDLSKSVPALFDIVNEKLAVGKIDESIALLYDMYWVTSEQPDHENLMAEIQMKIASVFGELGRYESARNGMNEAYKYFLIHKDVPRQIRVLNHLGDYALAERQRVVAISYYKQAVELGYRYHITEEVAGDSHLALAHAYFLNGQLDEALEMSLAAEALFRHRTPAKGQDEQDADARRCENADGIARSALQQALILAELDKLSEAKQTALIALHHFQATDDGIYLGKSTRALGDILCQAGDYAQARDYYLQSQAYMRSHWPCALHTIEIRLAELELSQGQVPEARHYAQAALQRLEEPYLRSQLYKLLAQCDFQSRDIGGYIIQMNRAVSALQSIGDEYAAALVQCELADVTNDFNLMREATRIMRKLNDEYMRLS